MTNAHRLCDAAKLDFSELFARQYLITGRRAKIDGMQKLPFGRYSVHVGHKLPISVLTDRHDRFFGYVLGIAVDPAGLIEGEHKVEALDLDDPALFSRFAAYLDDVSGRYVVVCGLSSEPRVYTDPVAMIGCLYDPTTGRVGSSLNLVLDRDEELNAKIDHDAITQRGGKYTLFHTSDTHVKRLNGSFFLDLDTCVPTRFWPRTDRFERPVSEYGAIYDEIVRHARHSIGAITDAYKTALPISGGRDSRLLTAFAGEHIQKVTQPFTHITNFATRYDASIASLIAEHLGIPHEIHSWRQPAPPERSKFEYRQDVRSFQIAVGAKIGMPDQLERNVHQFLGEDKVILRGHLTDLLRAVYVFTGRRKRWKSFGWQIQRLFPVPMSEFDENTFETYKDDFTNWRSSLPPAAVLEAQLDFMFIEVYYNTTVGFTFNGLHKHFYTSPFNSRRLIELCLAINVDYRRSYKPVDDVIYRVDPDLCAIPYYKEAGSDLGVVSTDADWGDITEERMADVRARHDNNYEDAQTYIAEGLEGQTKPILAATEKLAGE